MAHLRAAAGFLTSRGDVAGWDRPTTIHPGGTPTTTTGIRTAPRSVRRGPRGIRHDDDDDSTPAGDTDHGYWNADGTPKDLPKMAAEGRGGDAPGEGDKPYGNVHYADPGYQGDKQKRYPVDTKEHAQAAWSYISKDSNAAKYSSGDLAKVKASIKAACKKFGIAISEDSDGDGKKSTSSSGRQPAASGSAGPRRARGGRWQEGTGPRPGAH